MKLEPIKRYRPPRLPTRAILDRHPELLRLVPRRWRNSPTVMAALAALGLIGCDKSESAQSSETSSAETSTRTASSTRSNPSLAKVAPVFQHGEGNPSTGGMIARRITFLTEDEARKLIIDEAAKAKIAFAAETKTLPNIEIPVTNEHASFERRRQAKKGRSGAYLLELPLTQPGSLELDGYDAKRNIGFEFVSGEDHKAWHKQGKWGSTLTQYDLRGAAEQLRLSLKEGAPAGAFGVFYDPSPQDGDKQTKEWGSFDAGTRAPLTFFERQDGLSVTYDQAAKTITIVGDKTLRLSLGKADATIDGEPAKAAATVELRGDVPYLPLEFTAQALGGSATWDAAKQVVRVTVKRGATAWSSKVLVGRLAGIAEPATFAFHNTDAAAMAEATKEEAEKQLRAQVSDFIDWLAAQGII